MPVVPTVDRIEDESPARREGLKVFCNLSLNLCRSCPVQDTLGVDATSPKGEILAKFEFQLFGFHVNRIDLD